MAKDRTEAEVEGWQVRGRRKGKRLAMRRPKAEEKHFEDRVWCLLYRLGFPILSTGSQCFLVHDNTLPNSPKNQIDAVGIDDLVCVAVECKFQHKLGVRARLAKEIQHLASLKQRIQAGARAFAGTGRAIVPILWTFNVDFAQVQQERANGEGVILLDERDLAYYESLAKEIGEAARHQFLADLLPGKRLSAADFEVPAIRTKVNGRFAYTFSAHPSDLLPIAYFAHRVHGKGPMTDAYQRMVKGSRIKSIKSYISDANFFPNNILINVTDRNCLRFERAKKQFQGDVDFGMLYVSGRLGLAWIIDGQHRLLAYAGMEESSKHSVTVTAYDELPADIQARLFADINNKQKRVPQSLLLQISADIGLQAEKEVDRIHAIVTKVIQELESRPGSVFRGRVVMADQKKTPKRAITLTQFANVLIKPGFYVRKEKGGRITDPAALWRPDLADCIERTISIISFWFSGLVAANEAWWEHGSGPGGGLAMNNGVIICSNILRNVFDQLESELDNRLSGLTVQELQRVLRPFRDRLAEVLASLTDEERRSVRQLRGVGDVYNAGTRRLQAALRSVMPEFDPEGLDEWLEAQKSQANQEAMSLIAKIEPHIINSIVAELKELYGAANERFWLDGVPRAVRQKADERFNEDDGRRTDRWRYLDLIDSRTILQKKENWEKLGDDFAYPKGNQSKESGTKWLVKLNEIRRGVAHPASGEIVSSEDIDFLHEIFDFLFGTPEVIDD